MDLEVLMAPASIPSMAGISLDRWRRLSFKPRDRNGETTRALRSTSFYFEAKRETEDIIRTKNFFKCILFREKVLPWIKMDLMQKERQKEIWRFIFKEPRNDITIC